MATKNVSDLERAFSIAGGLSLGVLGMKKGSVAGMALAALGGALVVRGATGHCALKAALQKEEEDQEAKAVLELDDNGTRKDLKSAHNLKAQTIPKEQFGA